MPEIPSVALNPLGSIIAGNRLILPRDVIHDIMNIANLSIHYTYIIAQGRESIVAWTSLRMVFAHDPRDSVYSGEIDEIARFSRG